MTRMTPENRREVILSAAVKIAGERGLIHVTHSAVAKRCVIETSVKTVRHYFATQADLWRAIRAAAPQVDLGL